MSKDEFASKGVAGTALGFGIAGTALALANNNCGGGLFGGILGGNRHCHGHISPELYYYTIENERRVGAIEARQTATEAAVYLNAAHQKEVKALTAELTDRKIERAVCRKIDGGLFLAPDQMALPYHGARNQILSRQWNGDLGLDFGGGYCGGW